MKKRIDRLEVENKTLHADVDRQRVAVSREDEHSVDLSLVDP